MAARRARASSARRRSVTVPEHQHGPDRVPPLVAHGGGAVVDRPLRPVPGDEHRMVRQPDHHPLPQGSESGVLDRVARPLLQDPEDLRQGSARRFRLRPAGQGLGHAVEECDPAIGVGADDRIADAGQGDAQPLALGGQLPLGALAGGEDGLRVLQGDGPEPPLFVLLVSRHRIPSWSDARAVPSTRARILAKAVSRVVDVSSQNGANPQSSVVPSCSAGM